jgi:hypothetical protein
MLHCPNRYRWTKDGQAIDPLFDLGVKKERNNGSFVIHSGRLAQFQGMYQCYASNNLGTAVSEEIELIVPSECHSHVVRT